MESLETAKRNSSRQTPTHSVYFGVFLAIAVCSSFAFSVYSFKEVTALQREFRASRKPEPLDSNVDKMQMDRISKVNPRGKRSGTPGQRESMIPENILLYGDGREYNLQAEDVIKQWTVANKDGSIVYHSSVGRVEVMTEGFYFIYSQICFSGDRNLETAGHRTFINNDIKMETVIGRQNTRVACRYHGGGFYLHAHDTISVKPTATAEYYMSRKGSFLGVFLIRRAS